MRPHTHMHTAVIGIGVLSYLLHAELSLEPLLPLPFLHMTLILYNMTFSWAFYSSAFQKCVGVLCPPFLTDTQV